MNGKRTIIPIAEGAMCIQAAIGKLRAVWAKMWCSRTRTSRTISAERARPNRCFRTIVFLSLIGLALAWYLVDHFRWDTPWEPFRLFLEKLVEALFIAALLAFTVDVFLKKQIARDAFEASIGYILPEYLQEEMRAIYSNEIVCIEHSQDVRVEALDGDLVQMTINVYRRLKNISNNRHCLLPRLWVDEWFVEGKPSTIGDCTYKLEGGDRSAFGNPSIGSKEYAEGQVPKLYAEGKEIALSPGSTIEVWLSYSETKRRSDLSYLAFAYATDRPRVRIAVPPGFGSAVEFTHRLNTKRLTTEEAVLPGLLLPHQCIIARWWDDARRGDWERSATP